MRHRQGIYEGYSGMAVSEPTHDVHFWNQGAQYFLPVVIKVCPLRNGNDMSVASASLCLQWASSATTPAVMNMSASRAQASR